MPKYIHTYENRYGKTIYYFRRRNEIKIRLPDDPNSPEFLATYELALKGRVIPHVPVPSRQVRLQGAGRTK